MITAPISRRWVRVVGIAAYVVAVEWARALATQGQYAPLATVLLGGVALSVSAIGWRPDQLGLGWSRFGLRLLGGLALGAVLLLPSAARVATVPLMPVGLAVAAIAISIGEELAFRGALFASLEEAAGAPIAVIGTSALWTLAHILSHPPQFLVAVFAAGLVLGLWRWACRDLVAPIIGHVIADLAL